MWLEEQKRVILKKMDDYSLAHAQEVRNHEKTFDTEIQFGNTGCALSLQQDSQQGRHEHCFYAIITRIFYNKKTKQWRKIK